jgi:hypothetical protein
MAFHVAQIGFQSIFFLGVGDNCGQNLRNNVECCPSAVFLCLTQQINIFPITKIIVASKLIIIFMARLTKK